MASSLQQGRVRQPSAPGDHWDFKQLLLTINAWGMAPAKRGAAGPRSVPWGSVFAERSCPRALGQESPDSPDPRKQRADPARELPERFPSTWDCRLG